MVQGNVFSSFFFIIFLLHLQTQWSRICKLVGKLKTENTNLRQLRVCTLSVGDHQQGHHPQGATTLKVVTHWKNILTILTMISVLLFRNQKDKKKQYEHVYLKCASELTGPQFPAGIGESQDSGPGPIH
jgi:hypothetical protein